MFDRGKFRDVFVTIKNIANGSSLFEVYESKDSSKAKLTLNLKRLFAEIETQGTGILCLYLITTEHKFTFAFANAGDARKLHASIVEKSETHAENKAISHLDDEIKLVWPFPGSSFFGSH
jgi:hypothetical protein